MRSAVGAGSRGEQRGKARRVRAHALTHYPRRASEPGAGRQQHLISGDIDGGEVQQLIETPAIDGGTEQNRPWRRQLLPR